MRWLFDLLYAMAAVLSSPIWLVAMIRTGKIRTDWRGRFGAAPRLGPAPHGRILLHAVSVGEINAIRLLVDALADRPDPPDIVIAATTNTGIARATSLYADRHTVVRYPLDFSFSVGRFLRRVKPTAVGLVELEVWPNFTAALDRAGIPVTVINGRLTERSARRYRWIGPVVRKAMRRLAFVAVQDEAIGRRFIGLGVDELRVLMTGSMKWDTAEIADQVEGDEDLRLALGIDPEKPLIVAGSTAPDEHAMLHAVIEAVGSDVQLMCVPRRPEWFDDAAADLPNCVRRSAGTTPSAPTTRFLLDTIGELRAAYALADVVIVGRSFGRLHGSDMMEPIALGKPVIIGPATSDFRQQMEALRDNDAIIECERDGIASTVRRLLDDPAECAALAERGRDVIRAHQGATMRHAELLMSLLKADS
ncbi:MAG: glycosyltransferase N-terminal domain-containing protein [Planctomycetota bacterium]